MPGVGFGRERPESPVAADDILHTLLDAVRDLSRSRDIQAVQDVVRHAARELANADGATFVLREGEQCYYADEDAISPLWKGQRFPLDACISGWTMLHNTSAVIEDIYADDRVPHDAYRPTFVKSLLMVPIRASDPLGAIGMYWAEQHAPSDDEVGAAWALADSTAVALEHVLVLDQLAESVRLSETDSLTHLPNRRAWDDVLPRSLRGGRDVCMALMDLDRFKAFNDRDGHQAGDELLQAAAEGWRKAVRGGDIVARYGGDEFAVLLRDCKVEQAQEVSERLRRALPDGETASIGLAYWDGEEDADTLARRADEALYRAKNTGGDRVVFLP